MKEKKITDKEEIVETEEGMNAFETDRNENKKKTASEKSSDKKKRKSASPEAESSDAGENKDANGKKGGKKGADGKKGKRKESAGEEGSEGGNNGKKAQPYRYLISNRSVKRHVRKRNVAVLMTAFIAVTVVLGAVVYGISLMIQHNNLKILIDKPGANVLSLSSAAQFDVGSEVLALGGPRYMDNVSLVDFYSRIPEIRATDGAYLPDESKFLAATFYLKNVTDKTETYSEAVALREVTQNLDSAMRVMLIKEKEGAVTEDIYAKANAAEGGSAYDETASPEEVCPGQKFGSNGKFVESEEDVWIAKPFLSSQYALYNTDNRVAPGEVVKYTIIVWLEGWDKDCVDARLGGTIRLELQFIQS